MRAHRRYTVAGQLSTRACRIYSTSTLKWMRSVLHVSRIQKESKTGKNSCQYAQPVHNTQIHCFTVGSSGTNWSTFFFVDYQHIRKEVINMARTKPSRKHILLSSAPDSNPTFALGTFSVEGWIYWPHKWQVEQNIRKCVAKHSVSSITQYMLCNALI